MKVWLLALSAVLLALSYAAPQSFSQDQRSASPTDQNSSSSTAQSSPAAAAPAVEPADPEERKKPTLRRASSGADKSSQRE
jgi:hypothetical protein